MPGIIFFVAYTISATIALYFLVSNAMAIVQEIIARRHISQQQVEKNS